MDRLTITQLIKMIKTYYKNGDGRWTAIFRTKFSSAMKHILHLMGMLINKIVVRGMPFCCNLPTDSSVVKLDIFEVIRTQNVLTYEHYLCCLQQLKRFTSSKKWNKVVGIFVRLRQP